MHKVIISVRGDKEAYMALEMAGDNIVDLLPGGIMQRAPWPVERNAKGLMADSISLGTATQIEWCLRRSCLARDLYK